MTSIRELHDLPLSPLAHNLLASRNRSLGPGMAAGCVRELAWLDSGDGPAAVIVPEAVERMVEFEQWFGGLWYTILRDGENGMEYGLHGDCGIFQTKFGPAFRGIMDGELTQPLYILHDGRTVRRPRVNYVPDRVIDSGVIQRIESHALLAVAGHWPHHRYTLTVPSGAEPAVGTGRFPPAVPEATGPATRWWFDGDRAVLLRLASWRTRRAGMIKAEADRWIMWCFARTEPDLAWASARRGDIQGDTVPGREWCVICLSGTPEAVSCIPAAGRA